MVSAPGTQIRSISRPVAMNLGIHVEDYPLTAPQPSDARLTRVS